MKVLANTTHCSGSIHWSAWLKKGWIFERTSRCKGWSTRARLSVDVACVLRKTEWENERKDERVWEGGKGRSRKRSEKREQRERERERERKRNKKKEREYTCVHAQLSPLEYTWATKPASSLFPTSFLESLLTRFAIFPTPRWLPLPLLLFSSLYVPCTSRPYTPPPSWCPFSTRNWLLTKDRPGRSSHRQIESALHFMSLPSMALCPHYALVITIRPLFVYLIFSLHIDTTENASSDNGGGRIA